MQLWPSRSTALATLSLAFTLAGCGAPSGPLDDDAKIIRATVRLMASDGQPLCVDRDTAGKPLAIFSTMIVAPVEARRMLAWRPPSPLRPPHEPSTDAIYRDSMQDRAVRLDEPTPPTDGLPPLEQMRLDGLARSLSDREVSSVAIVAGWGGPKVTARWWPFNRLSRSCTPLFVVSDPVRSRTAAFVTVKAGHWGTTYALERRGADWQPIAEWSRWLY